MLLLTFLTSRSRRRLFPPASRQPSSSLCPKSLLRLVLTALTPILMKCFKKLVLQHIKDNHPQHWTFSETKPSRKCHVAAVAAILLTAINELCILHHISWNKRNTGKTMSPSMLWGPRITMTRRKSHETEQLQHRSTYTAKFQDYRCIWSP